MTNAIQTSDTMIEIIVVDHAGKKAFQFIYEDSIMALDSLFSSDFDKGQPTICGAVSRINGTTASFWIQQTGGMGSYPSINLDNLFNGKAKPASTNKFLCPSDFELGDKIQLTSLGNYPFVSTWIRDVMTHSSPKLL